MLLIDPDTSERINANDSTIHFYKYSLKQFKNMRIIDINTLPKEQVFTEVNNAKYRREVILNLA
ncbi:hypothetical protein RH915_08325 [Serpentinicella sp. ANB-PHB4]|uniref:hypothetical protein n=1 Tax=Serpentinicella sp. ANB-PHB4 TaxID=3074076 RepID=UPI00285F4320|nr:hypothetical protein [Serpentinicella sp. ANB-PHB4]MDR5659496.1 hypothetical protein [Serpentinicella sp. ANB-PHB4]